jgi:hypothetical protein
MNVVDIETARLCRRLGECVESAMKAIDTAPPWGRADDDARRERNGAAIKLLFLIEERLAVHQSIRCLKEAAA